MNIIDLATKTMQIAIKGVVDAIKSTVDSIKAKVDTTATKVDAIDVKVGTLLDGRVVKSVQRGIIESDGQTLIHQFSVPIGSVNINKSQVILNGSRAAGTGYMLHTYVKSFTTNQLVVAVPPASNQQGMFYFSWQVIEFY